MRSDPKFSPSSLRMIARLSESLERRSGCHPARPLLCSDFVSRAIHHDPRGGRVSSEPCRTPESQGATAVKKFVLSAAVLILTSVSVSRGGEAAGVSGEKDASSKFAIAPGPFKPEFGVAQAVPVPRVVPRREARHLGPLGTAGRADDGRLVRPAHVRPGPPAVQAPPGDTTATRRSSATRTSSRCGRPRSGTPTG